jgi:hypothetical protein
MRKAILSAIAGLSAGLFALVMVGGALAASPAPPAPPTTTEAVEPTEPPLTPISGVVTTVTEADGDVVYYIGTMRVSIGPSWFWGTNHPLATFVGTDTVVNATGRTDLGPPESVKSKTTTPTTAERTPEFDVYTVNGETVRKPGKPPWAGGPKAVGASHPGSNHSGSND